MMWHNEWVRQAMCEWCDTMIELDKLCVNDATQWLSWASYVWMVWHNDGVRQAMCEWCDTMIELDKLCVNDVTQWLS